MSGGVSWRGAFKADYQTIFVEPWSVKTGFIAHERR